MAHITIRGLPDEVRHLAEVFARDVASYGHDVELHAESEADALAAAAGVPEPYGPPAHDRFAFHGTEPAPAAPESGAPTTT